jgi:hypothetical protein
MSKSKLRSSPSQVSLNGTDNSANKVVAKSSKKQLGYTSVGVADHDVFLLPSSDYQVMAVLTLVAAVIRLFRIYQPSSVVFDEVQYVTTLSLILDPH